MKRSANQTDSLAFDRGYRDGFAMRQHIGEGEGNDADRDFWCDEFNERQRRTYSGAYIIGMRDRAEAAE